MEKIRKSQSHRLGAHSQLAFHSSRTRKMLNQVGSGEKQAAPSQEVKRSKAAGEGNDIQSLGGRSIAVQPHYRGRVCCAPAPIDMIR